MANNNRNNAADRKKAQELEAEKPFGDLNQPLGGNDPDYVPDPKNPRFDPEGRVMAAEAKSALLDDTEPSKPATYDLGSEASITQIATSPDAWIVESNGESFTFTGGDVRAFLTERGVTNIDDRSST